MTTQNGICVQVDQQKKVGVSDVIAMLKGLRTEVAVKVVKTAEKRNSSYGTTIFNLHKEKEIARQEEQKVVPTLSSRPSSTCPEIEELNDIAHLLKSMESSQDHFYTMFKD